MMGDSSAPYPPHPHLLLSSLPPPLSLLLSNPIQSPPLFLSSTTSPHFLAPVIPPSCVPPFSTPIPQPSAFNPLPPPCCLGASGGNTEATGGTANLLTAVVPGTRPTWHSNCGESPAAPRCSMLSRSEGDGAYAVQSHVGVVRGWNVLSADGIIG